MTKKEDFLKLVSERVVEVWQEKKMPYLLSQIPPYVKRFGDYNVKDITEGISLKAFFEHEQSTPGCSFEVVSHPTIKASVGLIPKDETYVFPEKSKSSTGLGGVQGQGRQEKIVRDFLSLLSRLPSDDLKRVDIPVDVLARLMFLK